MDIQEEVRIFATEKAIDELLQMSKVLSSVNDLSGLANLLQLKKEELKNEKNPLSGSISGVNYCENDRILEFKISTSGAAKTAVLEKWINSINLLDGVIKVYMLYMAYDGLNYFITNDAYGVCYPRFAFVDDSGILLFCNNKEEIPKSKNIHIHELDIVLN